MIVGGDRRQADLRIGGVDEDDRQLGVGQPLAMAAAEAAGGDHDAVDPAVDQQVEIAGLAFRIVGGVAQQDRVAQVPRGVLDGPDELRKERDSRCR